VVVGHVLLYPVAAAPPSARARAPIKRAAESWRAASRSVPSTGSRAASRPAPGADQALSATTRSTGTSLERPPDFNPGPQRRALLTVIDLRPSSLDLRGLVRRRGGEFYRTLAAYGHFGRVDVEAPWEREDLVEPLRKALGR